MITQVNLQAIESKLLIKGKTTLEKLHSILNISIYMLKTFCLNNLNLTNSIVRPHFGSRFILVIYFDRLPR